MPKEKIHPHTYSCIECGKESIFRVSKTNLYCGQSCQQLTQRKERIRQWLEEGIDWGNNIPGWVKGKNGFLAQQSGYKCAICGINEWNNCSINLECDHIDGDHKNNHYNNLRLICPNCHSQTSTYKNKNAGKGRTSRRKLAYFS